MKTSKKHLRAKARVAKKSLTVWFANAVPLLLAGATELKDQLPALAYVLTGWRMVAASVVIGLVISWLRVRNVKADEGHDSEVQ